VSCGCEQAPAWQMSAVQLLLSGVHAEPSGFVDHALVLSAD
jgi:hypothetical protein